METLEKADVESVAEHDDVFSSLLPCSVGSKQSHDCAERVTTPIVATLVEFDLEERPVVRSDRLFAGELLKARSTVKLERASLGAAVVVLCENGDPRLPIVIGVIERPVRMPVPALTAEQRVMIQADDNRYVVDAEREIVLRCGDSSITLTRAGKVIIKGRYILSSSSGYNKVKGAAVDIN